MPIAMGEICDESKDISRRDAKAQREREDERSAANRIYSRHFG